MENLQSKNFTSYIETANKLSWKESFGTFRHKKAKQGEWLRLQRESFQQWINLTNVSFYFEHVRPIEGVQHNDFESSVIFAQVVYCSIIL